MWERLVVATFLGLLQLMLQRGDLRKRALAEAKNEATERALVALGWRADAVGEPDGGAGLRSAGGKLKLPSRDPHSSSGP